MQGGLRGLALKALRLRVGTGDNYRGYEGSLDSFGLGVSGLFGAYS